MLVKNCFLFLRLTIKQINVANFIHGKLLIKIDGFYNKKGCNRKWERERKGEEKVINLIFSEKPSTKLYP